MALITPQRVNNNQINCLYTISEILKPLFIIRSYVSHHIQKWAKSTWPVIDFIV